MNADTSRYLQEPLRSLESACIHCLEGAMECVKHRHPDIELEIAKVIEHLKTKIGHGNHGKTR